MELCSALVTNEGASAEKLAQPDTAMEQGEGHVNVKRSDGGRVAETETDIALAKDQEMVTEEQEITSQTEQGRVTEMTH